jgi:hypothetical protein
MKRSLPSGMTLALLAASLSVSDASGEGVGASSGQRHKFYEDTGKFAGNYLCLPTASGGIKWFDDRKQWGGVAFKSDGNRVVIKVMRASTNPELGIDAAGRKEWKSFGFNISAITYLLNVKTFGKDDEVSCWGPRDRYQPSDLTGYNHVLMSPEGQFRCDAYGWNAYFIVNLSTRRYFQVYTAGFIDGRDVGGNTPSIQAGKCEKID